jgi:hypothetical protein
MEGGWPASTKRYHYDLALLARLLISQRIVMD